MSVTLWYIEYYFQNGFAFEEGEYMAWDDEAFMAVFGPHDDSYLL